MGMKPRAGYDEKLAERIRSMLGPVRGVSERKMFGGLAFMVNGNMACGIVKDELMVRVGPDRWEELLALPHARVMDFTGKPMRGMVYVGRKGIASDTGLADWVARGAAFAYTLSPK